MTLTIAVTAMRNEVFFDSNVLLYLPDKDRSKADTAERLLSEGGVVNALVLAEATYVMSRRWKWAWVAIDEMLVAYRANTLVLPFPDEANRLGLAYAERYGLQSYDAAIVASAVLAGCTTLYSEDMQSGLVIDGVTIRNPFRD